MKTRVHAILREILSPSVRFELRDKLAWFKEQIDRARIWRWEITERGPSDGSSYAVCYVGRAHRRKLALAMLKLDGEFERRQSWTFPSHDTIVVGDAWMAGALRVPISVRAVVSLGMPINKVVLGYGEKLLRLLLKNRSRYRTERVFVDREIDRFDREMLRPYADARRGESAVHQGSDLVRRIAVELGRLDVVYDDESIVACHLGFSQIRRKKRYWTASRFGYPPAVFRDSKRLHEVNSMNAYLAMEWAIENGFDFYDIGNCVGLPDDGTLQWKRRRGGAVDTMANHESFYVRLPSHLSPRFLWDVPLFAIEYGKLTLHLGVPEGPTDQEIATRYREMGYGGISTVYLHCRKRPSTELLTAIGTYYGRQKSPPQLRTILAPVTDDG